MDYQEPCCPFDATPYTGTPDTAPTGETIDVPSIIAQLDKMYEQGDENNAEQFLEQWRERATSLGDWRGELGMLSELLGQYRRSGNKEKGLTAAKDATELIRSHRMADTVSGATVMLNAATTMKCFGEAKASIPMFTQVSRVYSANLDPGDYRFGGLYNNMALSYADIGDTASAERFFKLAMQVISRCRNPENELAVTLCNMAEMYYNRDPEDERVNDCMEKAWEYLNSPDLPWNGYHAFTVSKCAPSFAYFGFFLYAKELKERAEKIYAGN